APAAAYGGCPNGRRGGAPSGLLGAPGRSLKASDDILGTQRGSDASGATGTASVKHSGVHVIGESIAYSGAHATHDRRGDHRDQCGGLGGGRLPLCESVEGVE